MEPLGNHKIEVATTLLTTPLLIMVIEYGVIVTLIDDYKNP
jgi:hypothetical protein